MLLTYSPSDARPSPEVAQAAMPTRIASASALQRSVAPVAAHALQSTDTATTVRVRDGETLISDGPFAETKEALGGYYLIDVPDLDAALEWAAKVPNVGYGSIEVRPVMVFDEPRA